MVRLFLPNQESSPWKGYLYLQRSLLTPRNPNHNGHYLNPCVNYWLNPQIWLWGYMLGPNDPISMIVNLPKMFFTKPIHLPDSWKSFRVFLGWATNHRSLKRHHLSPCCCLAQKCGIKVVCFKIDYEKKMCHFLHTNRKHMGVSKNRGTPKWMVYNGKPY